jgi:hypothetical protein
MDSRESCACTPSPGCGGKLIVGFLTVTTMFLVSHSLETRAKEIRSWLPKNPSIALIVAAVYFEWAICRAVIGLSKRPNKELREKLRDYYSLPAYKDLWRDELEHLPDRKRLPQAVSNWHEVTVAFDARNRLVHGRDRYTPNMAKPLVESLLAAVADISAYCLFRGLDINKRLPQRRSKRG